MTWNKICLHLLAWKVKCFFSFVCTFYLEIQGFVAKGAVSGYVEDTKRFVFGVFYMPKGLLGFWQ